MQLFKPELTAIPQLDDVFLILSTTPTPNSCFFAGPARKGLPDGVVVTPETVPLILELRLRGEICLPHLKNVDHRITVTLGEGKTQVTAFVVLDGKVLGQNTIYPVGGGPEIEALRASFSQDCFPTRDWQAFDNQQPPGPRSLLVFGIVEAPTPGYRAYLEPGASIPVPKQLPLNLVVEKLPGDWPEVITPIPVQFRKEPYAGEFETVKVFQGNSDCPTVTIDIEEIH